MKLYNTMTRQLEELKDNKEVVTIYTCGPTVYSNPHIGNWRTFVFYDTLIRALHVAGYDTNRTINLTDVGHLVGDGDEGEDKLQQAATKERTTAWEVAEKHIAAFNEGMIALNMVSADHVVRATDMIEQQIDMVRTLEDKGYAYTVDDGVYFDTSTLADYGKLARLKLDQQQAGARVEVNPQKRNASDFALWKFSPQNEQRDMEWESPWGVGFPGWHLECSAIAEHTLGETITIHTGGVDHIPVHHTNEIAQSEAAHGVEFAHLWIHAEHILVEGEKMSKSLKNDYTLQDLVAKEYDLLDFRMLCLMSKYRTQQNFTWQSLDDARTLRRDLRALGARLHQQTDTNPDTRVLEVIHEASRSIMDAITSDLNTPEVLAIAGKLKDRLDQEALDREAIKALRDAVLLLDSVTGLKIAEVQDINKEEYELIMQRETLRAANQFADADRVRNQLQARGVELNDTPWGSVWFYN